MITKQLLLLLFAATASLFSGAALAAEKSTPAAYQEDDEQESQKNNAQNLAGFIINDIKIIGNKQVSTQAILAKIPYRKGQRFDPLKTRELIRNLYYDFRRFRTITVESEIVGPEQMDLYILVTEKIPLISVRFEGNSAITEKEILEKVTALEAPALDEEELKIFATAIKRLYLERGYYNAAIDPELIVEEDGRGSLIFHIVEGNKSLVKKIYFKGNKHVSSKILRGILYTKEDWLFSFLDKSGTFLPERLEGDKHVIEMYYQSHGYLTAKVVAITPIVNPQTNNFDILFEIQEGDLYRIGSVQAPGTDTVPESLLLAAINIKPGQLYSREKIVDAIKTLELIWGNQGYLYAHIDPSINPNDDTKTVNLIFTTELGNKITLGKMTIRGNKKSKDKIIRRQITFAEGDLLTNFHMEASKERVQSLGYFDPREGVNWRVIRTGADTADLDLLLKETKTGHAGFQLSFAGSEKSIREPLKGASLQLDVGDTNLLGTGLRTNLTSRFSHEDFTLGFNITQPWLFDRPILGAIDVFHKRVAYEDFNYTVPVNEVDTGFALSNGFMVQFPYDYLRDTYFRLTFGVDSIKYQQTPRAFIHELPEGLRQNAELNYDILLNKMFVPGNYGSITAQIGQEKKNHPMHPSAGYTWFARSLFTLNVSQACLGFHKFDVEGHWFTPLIGTHDLIFHMRGYAGLITPLSKRLIPYRELYHIGGPASVRGYLYGQIGPQFNVYDIENILAQGDSIGGTKAIFMSTELLFPITQDMNFKGVLFFDGGAGWDNPYVDCVEKRYIRNNHFNFRSAVGFGIRIYNPMPIKIDWGFKLDPRSGEPAYEVHFNSSYDW